MGHSIRNPELVVALDLLLTQTTCTPDAFGVHCGVPTYIYQTTDPSKPIRQFEVKQSIHDDPLSVDPETGEAARRIISIGYSVLVPGKSVGPSVGSVGSH